MLNGRESRNHHRQYALGSGLCGAQHKSNGHRQDGCGKGIYPSDAFLRSGYMNVRGTDWCDDWNRTGRKWYDLSSDGTPCISGQLRTLYGSTGEICGGAGKTGSSSSIFKGNGDVKMEGERN
jgi:hypothetical protein